MNISRRKFVISFFIFGFSFLFITTSLLGSTGPRGFPQFPDSVLHTGSDSPIAWKSTLSTIVWPVKLVLIGPLMPYIEFLRQEPDTPPPFFGIGMVLYWSILAPSIYYLLGKLKLLNSAQR